MAATFFDELLLNKKSSKIETSLYRLRPITLDNNTMASATSRVKMDWTLQRFLRFCQVSCLKRKLGNIRSEKLNLSIEINVSLEEKCACHSRCYSFSAVSRKEYNSKSTMR
jgi:hypothetical protein